MAFRSSSCMMDHLGFLSEPLSFSRYQYKVSRCDSFKKCSGLKGRQSSATFRKPLSERNMMHPLNRNEDNSQRIDACHFCRVMLSRKNGLLVSVDSRVEFSRMGMMNSLNQESHLERSSPFVEVQSERDMITYPQCPLEEHRNHGTHKIMDSVNGGSMSENSVRAEKFLGLNGTALVWTARGCFPVHASEIEHRKESSNIKDGVRGEEQSSETESSSTDLYYQKMLEENPQSPLLLRNYAKFLHEVQRDMKKAEEYFARAVMSSPGDGEILSLYAEFIWETRKDLGRAQTYFERAVEAAPQDCYVIASYAHFLWSCEEDEEENDLTT